MVSYASELGRCPLFARLAAGDVERLAAESRLVKAPAGQTIFRQGDECLGFYVVLEGGVRLYKIAPDGRERTLHIVYAPHAFAEAAMFMSGTYPAFAAAIADARLVLIYKEPFVRLMREQPDCSLRMFESLSLWLHRLLDQLENETFLNARAKLANYLLRAARRRGVETGPCHVDLGAAKKDVASQLGMAPETFSRAQADLESRRLIHPAGRQIAIADVAALESLVLGEETVS